MLLYSIFQFLITLHCGVFVVGKINYFRDSENVSVKFLVTSSTGMQFQRVVDDDDNVGIIYDCTIGMLDEGVINVFDNAHPDYTDYVNIQNCENITLSICPSYLRGNGIKLKFFKQLSATNITTLSFFKEQDCEYTRQSTPHIGPERLYLNSFDYYQSYEGPINTPKTFYINNVENLELLENSCKYFPNVALSIENTTIGKLYEKAISSGVAALQLQNVNIQTFEQNGIYLNYDHENYDPILIIKDCHFGTLDGKTIFVNGSKVEISNNSFQYLEDNVFTVNATKTFSFSDNYIRKMEAPFDVRSSNIHITGNTFDIIKKPWLAGLRVISGPENRVFNVSQNSMKIYPQHYFVMDPASRPDVITFHDNNFNCSCQYWSYNEFENSEISAYLLQKTSNNVCGNLGNCPLWRALRHMDEICDDTFNCSEAQKPKLSTETYLQMILSTLKDMKATLHSLTSKNKLLTISNEVDRTEEPITTGPVVMVP